MPQAAYLIATAPGCGSDFLCELLKGMKRVGMPEEYFDPARCLEWRTKFPGVDYGEFLSDVVRQFTNAEGLFGAVVQRHQFLNLRRCLGLTPESNSDDLRRKLAEAFGACRYIRLCRGNQAAQAVTWLREILSRQAASGDAPPETAFDPIRASDLLRTLRRFEAEWDEFFDSISARPLVVDYEDLVADSQTALKEVLTYLGILDVAAASSDKPLPASSEDETAFDWLQKFAKHSPIDSACTEAAERYNREASDAFARGDLARGERQFRRALVWNPLSHGINHNYGATLATQGKHDEAIRYFLRAEALRPGALDTARNLGLAYVHAGQFQEAEACYRRAVAAAPDNPASHFELGQFLRSRKRHEDAIAIYREVVRLQPDHADAYYGLGLCYGDLNRRDEALRAYEDALRARPTFPEVQNNLGVLYEERGELQKAKEAYQAALALRPEWPEALNNYGVVLAADLDFVEAERQYRLALKAAPNSPSVLNNLGNALRAQGKLDESVAVLRKSLELKPHYSEAYNNLGITLMNKGLPDEAIAHYNQALYFVPDYPEPHLNRSLAWLSLCDFDNGWVEYEWRWRGKSFAPRDYRQPRWDGGDLRGRTLLVYAEQGLGDTLQFIRYAALAKQRGAQVVAHVQKPLLPILASFAGVDRWLPNDGPPPETFDVHAPLLSLPGIFKTSAVSIPAQIPYLSADPGLVETWRERLAGGGEFRIGIAWQGNPQYRGDRMRSIPLKYFETLARIPGVRLVSLQKKHGLEQLSEVDFSVQTLDGLDEEAGPFMDTAAVMKNLDLVIASDSAIVHLGGALGIPIWVILPLAADWRWFRNREDSPWYPTMRLFRQSQVGRWDDVFERLTEALLVRVRTGGLRVNGSKDPLRCETPTFQQGTSLAKAGKFAEAEEYLLRAAAEDPESAVIAHNLGAVLALQGKLTEAVEHFRKAVAAAPRYGDAHGNLGLAYLELSKPDDAIRHFREALDCGANPTAMHNNLGAAMMDAGRTRDAVASYRQSLLLNPKFPEAHLNLARGLLALGQYDEGWLEYEWRRHCKGYRIRKFSRPAWAGEPLGGKTILLHDDAPPEDYLQFLRYAPLIEQRGGRVVVLAPKSWGSLLARCRGVAAVVAQDEPLPPFAVQALISGLPGLFKTNLSTVPANIPYLRLTEDEETNSGDWWNASQSGARIALVRPLYDRATQRAEFSALAPLVGRSGVQIVRSPIWAESGDPTSVPSPVADAAELAARVPTTCDPLKLATWLGSADIVIAADGPEAHLAAACGKEVWLLLDKACNWRWMLNRTRTPWYPQMKLFRRHANEAPEAVFGRVLEELDRMVPQQAGV